MHAEPKYFTDAVDISRQTKRTMIICKDGPDKYPVVSPTLVRKLGFQVLAGVNPDGYLYPHPRLPRYMQNNIHLHNILYRHESSTHNSRRI